ncbi:hypothetical protein [Pseudomonas paraveronii]|uniref:hypothetical protein n=1 Tax=Pseudomonas paraveronii TaxID=3040598 RepID=UPI002AB1C713|nr:hypothetical protein [Pseudomonas sp. V3/K/3/5]
MKSLKRSRFPSPALAYWPQYWPEFENVWYMMELQLRRDGVLDWFLRRENQSGPIMYDNLEDALIDAKSSNEGLVGVVDKLNLSDAESISLKLKVEKAITVEERLMKEERWMLAEALRRNVNAARPNIEDLKLPLGCEVLREPLFNILREFPYVRYARINRYGITLVRKEGGDWSQRGIHSKQTAVYCYREKIARAFDLEGTAHWGKTKAAIRAELLPRANQLLHDVGFKMMLDDARRRGQSVVVCGSFVFWYEAKNEVGWVVKQVAASSNGDGAQTIWQQGTIISTNYGRIVVLPYIKKTGELVKGHTKNSSHDGPAKLRHADHYVELPFEVLEGDLMYDLFGRLQYE